MFSLADILHPLNVIGRKPIADNVTVLRSSVGGIHDFFVDCVGQIIVHSISAGQPVKATYSDLSSAIIDIPADANTDITIIGDLTYFNNYYNDYITYYRGNSALTGLDLLSCWYVAELDLSVCTSLIYIDIGTCYGLTTIKYPATNSSVSTAVAQAITNATAADGTVYTDSAADYYSTIETAANNKGWTIAQL